MLYQRPACEAHVQRDVTQLGPEIQLTQWTAPGQPKKKVVQTDMHEADGSQSALSVLHSPYHGCCASRGVE